MWDPEPAPGSPTSAGAKEPDGNFRLFPCLSFLDSLSIPGRCLPRKDRHTPPAPSSGDEPEGVKQEKEGKETKSLVSLAAIKAQLHTLPGTAPASVISHALSHLTMTCR